MNIPDRVGEILAWRAWYVLNIEGEQPYLGSINSKRVWPVGEELTAVCSIPWGHDQLIRKPHESPLEDCSCGIHAAKTLTQALDYAHHKQESYFLDQVGVNIVGVCLGQVQLWGKVEEGTKAYRAQYAYPKIMLVPTGDEFIMRVAANYKMESRSDPIIDALYHKIKVTARTTMFTNPTGPVIYTTASTNANAGSVNHFTLKYSGPGT